jgi:uncharacterized membrane protein (DUF485 family)
MTLRRINAGLHKISTPLNIINILVGLLIGIAHVYIPLTSVWGLVLGILMASSSSVSMSLNYYFTSQNTAENGANQPNNRAREATPLRREHTTKSNLFLGVVIPMILLNAAASFFGMYTGTILLAASLATPLGPPAVLAIAVTLATVLAVGTLINSWLQAHNIWERFKKPVQPSPGNAEGAEELDAAAAQPRVANRPKYAIELQPIPPFRPKSQMSSTQNPATLFNKTKELKEEETLRQGKALKPHHRRTQSF